ncbi:2-deoxy-D-gluconate 3-dehydrogenase [Coprinopsis cinerea okayama7|uniref:2-deoxy-D-gluconate 3-dehydrogenase n=1 Tax=Coprinopsis cinerea (strain Okayama-7 / 130 / ATCC MYA-4618 / FGSC 9003) TaxID=240176 RepID=A8NBX4_COPC7|nr:2-deoxy-D-gluconate 3-dehydrogenase [Coprinopsis cinerea okayama7\|eukprot:XP_001832334.2 2-deoxy-D-gluconate 3-dehydrogenase [Coprinopsis cinerea okayama7\
MDPSPAIPALDLFSLRGQNVLITGATRGIGAACAIALAEAGASICLVQRHPTKDGPEPNLTTYNAIKALFDNDDPANQRTLEIVHCDLDNLDEVKGLFDRALEVFPNKEIHVLVNCAGIQRRAPAVDFGEKEWDEDISGQGPQGHNPAPVATRCALHVLNVNLKSVFLLSQAAGRHMVPLRRGKIINFCSLLTFQGGFTVPAYAAAKGALGQLTKAFANEWTSSSTTFRFPVFAVCRFGPSDALRPLWLARFRNSSHNGETATCGLVSVISLHFCCFLGAALARRERSSPVLSPDVGYL